MTEQEEQRILSIAGKLRIWTDRLDQGGQYIDTASWHKRPMAEVLEEIEDKVAGLICSPVAAAAQPKAPSPTHGTERPRCECGCERWFTGRNEDGSERYDCPLCHANDVIEKLRARRDDEPIPIFKTINREFGKHLNREGTTNEMHVPQDSQADSLRHPEQELPEGSAPQKGTGAGREASCGRVAGEGDGADAALVPVPSSTPLSFEEQAAKLTKVCMAWVGKYSRRIDTEFWRQMQPYLEEMLANALAEIAYDESPAIPFKPGEVQRIVADVTSKDRKEPPCPST